VAVVSRWLEGSGFAVHPDAEGVHLVATHPRRPDMLIAVTGRSEVQPRIEVKRAVAERLRAAAAELGLEPFVALVGQTPEDDCVAYLAPLWYVEALPGEAGHQWHMTDAKRYQHEASLFVSHVRLREHPELL
jgi:hypothetical protein